MIQNILNALIPAKLTEMCKRAKGDVMEGIKYLVVGGVISLVLMMVQMVLVGLISGRMLLEVAGIIALVIGWVIMLIPTIIVFYVILWIAHFLIAKLLKGKAAFPQLFFLAAVLTAGIQVLNAAVAIVTGIITVVSLGIGGLLAMLAALAIGIYGLYLFYTLLKSVYGFEMMQAILALIVYLIVGGVVYFLIMMVIFALILGLVGAGALGAVGAMGVRPAF